MLGLRLLDDFLRRRAIIPNRIHKMIKQIQNLPFLISEQKSKQNVSFWGRNLNKRTHDTDRCNH
jgi:hypothetical protein